MSFSPFISLHVTIFNNFFHDKKKNRSVLGDPRTNQHPPLLALGILFYRWHNVIAARIQLENPNMSDEDIFQKARRVVIGTLQVKIFFIYIF